MATLATGLLLGPAGNQIISSNNLVNFFEQVRKWYGNNRSLKGQESAVDLKQYDLGLSQKTHAQSFNVYVPFGEARVELPQGVAVPPPSFGSFFNGAVTTSNLATLTGLLGYGMENIIPAGTALPYTIRFENAAAADSNVGEVRIVTKLDDDLNPRSFQLGSLRLGDIQIHIPTGRGTFSGDFDFTSSKGFILRVSAGLDVISNTATWLIQAIDPNTGEVVQNRDIGLLPPNKANGVGSAFVSYTTSVLNPVNFEVVSASGTITPQSVRYDAKTRTVLLDFNTLTPDHYELRVSPNLKSTAGAELTDGYKEQFTAVSDFSVLVDLKFTNPRSDRQHQTISYDVILTSKASSDLLLPVMLLLDPAQSFTGVPTDATRNASGTYENVQFTVSDGIEKVVQSATILIAPTNQAPTLIRPANTIVREGTNRAPAIAEFTNITLNRGETRELVLRVSDADNDPLVLQLKAESTGYNIPDFVKFTDNGDGTATLHLTPGVSDGGNYSLTLTAVDNGNGGGVNAVQRDEYTFVVSVNAPNDAPKLPFIGNKVAVVGETLEFIVKASDRNQDNLNFNLNGLPVGATLTPTAIYGEALFSWTPTLADIRTYPVTIQVQDSGNGNSSEVLSSQQAFNLVVRTANTAPILRAIANQTVAEGQTLTLALSSSDADGDTLTYSASNLPPGAVLDSAQGILTWTPNLAQAGTYNNIIVSASDGNKSSSQSFAILVNNTNQAPVLAPLPIQTGLENNLVQFTLAAGDIDNDSLIYSAVSPLPTGAAFDPRTGQFPWKPNYEQAGEYILRFAATDAQGATDIRDVNLRIANVNRSPAISVSPHAVALGERLQFTVAGTDPDNGTNLTYSAVDLPLGAVLDGLTGRFTWTPNPGQVGDYAVTYAVTDGEKTVTQTSLVRVAVAPTPPIVNFDLTPSFPAVPGQKVIVQTLANGLAAITNITATVDGRPVTVDSQGRIEIIPTTPGRLVVDVTATDADGRVGHNSTVVKVRDLQDLAAPIVAFAPGLDGALVKSVTNIIGSVNDSNLDSWVLEIADFGENVYRTLASGNGAVSDLTLAQFDPGKLENGFYQLRLRATDISDRTSFTEAVVEVNTTTKPSAYTRTQTDLSVTLGGNTINLVRTYSSLNTDEFGSFGNAWQLANVDTNIQTLVPLTGREELGVYEPFRVGTRLYLTTPTRERVGFTFAPQKHTIPGLTYYTPSWVADSGVNYTLSSADAKLTLAGNRFYDLKTGHAYNPGSGEFDGADYTLSSANGTVYHLSSAGGVTEQIGVNGTRLIYSDSGITSDTGETVRFVKDEKGRLTQITAPDGSLVVYSYDTEGNLVSARNLASGQSSRYGYSSNLLTLATGTPGTAGEAITYSTTPQVSPVLADLGSAAQFQSKTINDSVGDRYTFSLRDSELRSTATGTVLLGVELQGNMTLPTLLGLTPVATHVDANGSYALFAVNRAGLNLISLSNTSPTPSLPPSFTLFIAGDVNRDGNVDGVDSGLLAGAIASGVYNTTYDFNRDGVINAADVQILGSNCY